MVQPEKMPYRLIAFGLLAAFSSSIGQTFFISLSNEPFRMAHGLSSGGLAALYGVATLGGAVAMLFLGRLIDHLDLRTFTVAALCIAATGAFVAGSAENILALGAALFLLRLGGQGLLSHLAAVAVARTAVAGRRGQATGLALLGHALGEAVLPLLWIAAMMVTSWRHGWMTGAIVLVVVVLPLALCIMPHAARRQETLPMADHAAVKPRFLLANRSFVYFLLCVALPGTVVTATVFHLQVLATELPGGAHPGLALPALAAGGVVGTLAAGRLSDRIGPRRVLVLALVPLLAGTICFMGPLTLSLLMVALLLMGMAVGAVQAASAPAWVTLFGTSHVGRARSYQAFVVVAGTAASPMAFGAALDGGISPAVIFGATGVLTALTAGGGVAFTRRLDR